MAEYLVFTLTAALAGTGDLAGHERRGARSWPSKSAILGLLAAASGVRRDDGRGLAALAALFCAVGVFDPGGALRDYHTVQTIPAARMRRPHSRPEALRVAGHDTNTTITLRDYRVAPLYAVAVWGNADLPALAGALRQPVFPLYLGRKACPLAAPTGARLVEAAGPVEALAHAPIPPWRGERRLTLVASDPLPGHPATETRNDAVLDRKRWHFGPRAVALFVPEDIP